MRLNNNQNLRQKQASQRMNYQAFDEDSSKSLEEIGTYHQNDWLLQSQCNFLPLQSWANPQENELIISKDLTELNQTDPLAQSKENSADVSTISTYNSNSSNKSKKKSRRKGNTMVSNIARELKHAIDYELEGKNPVYLDQKRWREFKKLKSQIWAMDALCFKILHLRDVDSKITSREYQAILNHFRQKLLLKLNNTEDQTSKEKIQCFLLHVKEFLKPEFFFQSIDSFLIENERFFSKLVIKRKSQIEKSVIQLKEIYEALKQNQVLVYKHKKIINQKQAQKKTPKGGKRQVQCKF